MASHAKTNSKPLFNLLWIALGTFLIAVAIESFFVPYHLIDGGVVGLSMIIDMLTKQHSLPYLLLLINAPFVYIAYKELGRSFVTHMCFALVTFGAFSFILHGKHPFDGEILEVIVGGGIIMGIGIGIVIRMGACVDGTEILAILVNRKRGFTVGQVILFINIFIFALYGFIGKDWHIALNSFMTYFVAMKVIDLVIIGLKETKSVMIISSYPKEISAAIMKELGIGLTVMYGRGGFSGDAREILYVIVERLQLAELKEIIHREDPHAFIAIENLNEVLYGKNPVRITSHTIKTAGQ